MADEQDMCSSVTASKRSEAERLAPDDVERAREIIDEWIDEHDRGSWLDTELVALRSLIAAALTTATARGCKMAIQTVELEAKHWPADDQTQTIFVRVCNAIRALPHAPTGQGDESDA